MAAETATPSRSYGFLFLSAAFSARSGNPSSFVVSGFLISASFIRLAALSFISIFFDLVIVVALVVSLVLIMVWVELIRMIVHAVVIGIIVGIHRIASVIVWIAHFNSCDVVNSFAKLVHFIVGK